MSEESPQLTLGTWLVTARGEAGLTQEELAAETGIHVNTIKNIEAGNTLRPRAHVAARLRSRLDPPPLARGHLDRSTAAFQDLAGGFLMTLGEAERLDRIFEVTRFMLSGHSEGPSRHADRSASALARGIHASTCPGTLSGWLWYCDVHDSHGNGDSEREVVAVARAHEDFHTETDSEREGCAVYCFPREG